MIQHLGFGRLAMVCVAVLLTGLLVSASTSLASESTPVEVYSSAVDLGQRSNAKVEPLVPSDFADGLNKKEIDLPVTPSAASQIAEPGTLGLMALAGLMGGAMAMRHRLG